MPDKQHKKQAPIKESKGKRLPKRAKGHNANEEGTQDFGGRKSEFV